MVFLVKGRPDLVKGPDLGKGRPDLVRGRADHRYAVDAREAIGTLTVHGIPSR
jgi:hypothetical protein